MLKDLAKDYQYHILTENQADDSYERDLFKDFSSDDDKNEDSRAQAQTEKALLLLRRDPRRRSRASTATATRRDGARGSGRPSPT